MEPTEKYSSPWVVPLFVFDEIMGFLQKKTNIIAYAANL